MKTVTEQQSKTENSKLSSGPNATDHHFCIFSDIYYKNVTANYSFLFLPVQGDFKFIDLLSEDMRQLT